MEIYVGNRDRLVAGLISQYGLSNIEQKISDFGDFGLLQFSIVSHHNTFLTQIRDAFVSGAYYSSAVALATLVERILNHLVLDLRDSYTSRPSYSRISRRESFSNWGLIAQVLEDWSIVTPDTTSIIRRIERTRNEIAHYNPSVPGNFRTIALRLKEDVDLLVRRVFGLPGEIGWLLPGTRGQFFVAKRMEEHPFVRKYIRPLNHFVGPYFTMRHDGGRWMIHDRDDYESVEITDEEFASLFESRTESMLPGPDTSAGHS